ncbi:TetR/AcrR family transcriptional regulator [Odoribacter sp. OttesenSCG-928-J03]|nr:TetR/AcrR family transcriptional regulator [Odoribacter sp. OttesenSCG-928-J03]MDL2331086.1 TetR/AcrR family transcriptional regulator [Odoribacter sp. OttesenSCG-928-A06]
MKFTKENIILGAFSVFMEVGYDMTTISHLQRGLKISRGGIYRHFENKDALFCAVVDEYIFRTFDRILHGFNPDNGVVELINAFYKKQVTLFVLLSKLEMDHVSYLNYTALLFQAAKHYPNFTPRFKKIQNRIVDLWKTALYNSRDRGEIKPNLDFHSVANIYYDILMSDSKNETMGADFASDMLRHVEDKRIGCYAMYHLIKA